MESNRWAVCTGVVVLLFAVADGTCPAQTSDTLPLLEPAQYIPNAIPGFVNDSRSGLTRTDRQVMTGVQSGRKSYWVTPDLPFDVAAFDVSVSAYKYTRSTAARAFVEDDLRKSVSHLSRDTLSGLPVWVGVDRAGHRRTGVADVWIRYQQGRLAIDVWATKSLTQGSASLEDAREAARTALRAVLEEARQSDEGGSSSRSRRGT